MIIVCKPHASEEELRFLEREVTARGYEPRLIRGVEQCVIAAVGDETAHRSLEDLERFPCVQAVMPVQKRFKLASREYHPADSVFDLGHGARVGGGQFLVIAGPCAVESREQMRQVCQDLKAAGVKILRGGAFKPRSSPYDFQGLGQQGLDLLAEMKAEFGLGIATEAVGAPHVEAIAKVADLIQIGARNAQNYHLLEVVAGAGRPVLLKRGLASTVDEWLLAAEYLLVHGCPRVILCERGIRTFDHAARFTLDLGAVPIAQRETHLPVIVDPSHAAGRADLVLPLAKAAVAVGADGLIVETHPTPATACSDAAQQLPSAEFARFLATLEPLVALCCRPRSGG